MEGEIITCITHYTFSGYLWKEILNHSAGIMRNAQDCLYIARNSFSDEWCSPWPFCFCFWQMKLWLQTQYWTAVVNTGSCSSKMQGHCLGKSSCGLLSKYHKRKKQRTCLPHTFIVWCLWPSVVTLVLLYFLTCLSLTYMQTFHKQVINKWMNRVDRNLVFYNHNKVQ